VGGAARWFDIYRRSDWRALRTGAAGVFIHAVTEDAAERVRRAHRCVVIKPPEVRVEELSGLERELVIAAQ
jgi:hypothetical protein